MVDLGLICTRPTRLELTVFALKYVPVRTTMAHVADPLNQC
jgi:hypothetical protein